MDETLYVVSMSKEKNEIDKNICWKTWTCMSIPHDALRRLIRGELVFLNTPCKLVMDETSRAWDECG